MVCSSCSVQISRRVCEKIAQGVPKQLHLCCNTLGVFWLRRTFLQTAFQTAARHQIAWTFPFAVISCLPSSKVRVIQDTSIQDSPAPRTSRNMAESSRRSMSHQHSLRSRHSSHANHRPLAPPGATAGDKAFRADNATQHKEETGRSSQEGASADSQQANVGGQGIPRSQVPDSPFEQWRDGGDSARRDQPKVNADEAFGGQNAHLLLCFYQWFASARPALSLHHLLLYVNQ